METIVKCPKCNSHNVCVCGVGKFSCNVCGTAFKFQVNKMKVKDLLDAVKEQERNKKAEFATALLGRKLLEIARAKDVVAKLERDLEEFVELDLCDIDPCDYRY